MNNITNYSHRKFDFKLSNRKTFDFQLADYDGRDDNEAPEPILTLIGSQLTVNIQTNWSGLVTSTETIPTYGLTAIDNGAVPYISENTITSTTLTIPDNFELKQVSGYGNISYKIIPDMEYVSFRGGFYQGFYKLDGYDYQSLPNRYQKGWTIQTAIQPVDSSVDEYTLNDDERDTSGFFFYTGTRAENKFWNTFEKDNGYGEYEGVEEEGFIIPINPPRRVVRKVENEFLIYGRSNGRTYCGSKSVEGFGTKSAENFEQGSALYYLGEEESIPVNINEFLKYGRSSGYTYCGGKSKDYDKKYGQMSAEDDEPELVTELDIFDDIIDNAIGFRVKPDGSIGFRRVLPVKKTGKCIKLYDDGIELENFIFKYSKNEFFEGNIEIEFNDINGNLIFPEIMDENGEFVEPDLFLTEMGDYEGAKCIIFEEYTLPGLVIKNKFQDITLKWVADKELSNECEESRYGDLYVYVNGYLKHTFTDFKEIFNSPLYEHKGKQVGVPYNISIGGGTQGLKENRTLGGVDEDDKNLPLEQYFGGCFIGDMKYFKLFESPLTWCDIKSGLI